MAQKKSMTDAAYILMKQEKGEISFDKIWKGVCEGLGLDVDKARSRIAQFYTQLIIDGRFVTLGENVWDLRERCTFDKVHIDMNDVYIEDEEEIDIDEEDITGIEGVETDEEERKEEEGY